jgi:diguanylate cyclase (GGDEF)-like protein/PAS domain S-box-containing protein
MDLLGNPNARRLLTWVALLNLLVFGSVGLVLSRAYTQVSGEARMVADNVSRVLDEDLSRLIDKIDFSLLAVLDEIAREERGGGIDRSSLETLLAQFGSRLPEATGLRVVDADGRIAYAAKDVDTPGRDVSDREYFTRQRDDPGIGLFISKAFVGRLSNQSIIILSRRHNARDGSFAGVVDVAVPIQCLSAHFAAVELGSLGVVSLWDGTPSLVARYSRGRIVGEGRPTSLFEGIVRSYTTPVGYHMRGSVDGVDRQYFFRKVSRWPLFLSVGVADADYLVGWRREVAYLVGLSGLLLMTSVAMSVRLLQAMGASEQSQVEAEQAMARLRLSASVLTHVREGIAIADGEATLVEVNDSFTRITGYSREEALGRNPRFLGSGLHGPEFYVAMWQALLEDGYWSGEIWNRRRSGEVYAVLMTISAVRDGAGATQNYVALFNDITAMKEHQRQLEHIAHYDLLTDLPNRMLLIDRLRQALAQVERRGQSLAVVYIDLDGFKMVNDQYGHDIGDQFLVAISHHLKNALREGDTLARIGGDEFVAVLVDLDDEQDCEVVVARLLAAAASSVLVFGHVLHVSASIGVTLSPPDEVDADLLMRHADQAMYWAKQSGKNRYRFFGAGQCGGVFK